MINTTITTRRNFMLWTGALTAAPLLPAFGGEAEEVAPQPYFAAVARALEALGKVGAPIPQDDAKQIAALARQGDRASVAAADRILDRYTLLRVVVDSDGLVLGAAGGARRVLVEQGWSAFLVRVSNPSGATAELKMGAPYCSSGRVITFRSSDASRPEVRDKLDLSPDIARIWGCSEMYQVPAMQAALSGSPAEYRVIQIYSRDRGKREANIYFFAPTSRRYGALEEVAQRRGTRLEFDCLPSREVLLSIRDTDGRECMASLTIKDKLARVYPLQAMRLAPDMPFHAHIYRADGESVRLPDGEYTVESKRRPEYLRGLQTVVVGGAQNPMEVRLQRWIDPAKWGWYSGDTHIHAAGCAHYESPTEGVSPQTMIRQVRGEGLSIGDVLTWGPSWYYQKQFFTGRAESPGATLEHPELQLANNASLRPQPTAEDAESLLRYDIEVSGFPSSHCGHLVLLRLKDQDYPGTKIIQDWPSWNLPILRWAKSQGAAVGYAHCGIGMEVDSQELPNYEIPPMDGIGTQEGIVDVTHGLIDFISGCDTEPVAELNAWYHMLNCGFRLALIGETDYPCISADRPGAGRSYVRLAQRPIGNEGYEAWVLHLRQGKLYCGDGRSHFLEFKVNGRSSGEGDLVLKLPARVTIEALVAARLEPQVAVDPEIETRHLASSWHLEYARIEKTREVAVELVVNGLVVESIRLPADGTPRELGFKARMARSSWVALRVFPSSHTHPVFVQVGGKPIRASKRSAQWCRNCVDKIWEVKSPFMRESERAAAAEAFDHARNTYDALIAESEIA